MVVVCWWSPAFFDEEAGTEDLLGDKSPDLDPNPCCQSVESVRVGFHKEDVGRVEVEVGEGEKTEDGLAEDEFPAQGFAAVADDVAVDLGKPEREVYEGERVAVGRTEDEGPGGGMEGEEEEAEEGEVEFGVQSTHLAASGGER